MSLQIDFAGSVWRRERDSNPREIALKRISSAPRYDRFDISPYEIVWNFERKLQDGLEIHCTQSP